MTEPTHRTATALLVAAALFMEIMDSTVIATALPIIARDFGIPAAHLSVGMSAYLVAVTIFIPVSGWLADRFGARRIFLAALCTFIVASVLCALSTSLLTFTAARVLQGAGGALMVPVGRLVVIRHLPKEDIVRAVAILTWPALSAPLIGPVLGGWIAENWGWPWIFLINVPIGLLVMLAAMWLLKNETGPVSRFDVKGFVISGAGFGCLMAGLETLSQQPDSYTVTVALLMASLVLITLTVRHMLYSPRPLFSFAALRVRTFRTTVLGGSLVRIAISAAPFLVPLMLQLGMGYSAVEAGSLLLWLFAGNLAIKPATTWLMNRCGFKQVLMGNVIILALSFIAIAQVDITTPSWLVALYLFISGASRSMHLTVLNTLNFADISQQDMRDANTLSAVLGQMNRGLGITVGAVALAAATWWLGNDTSSPTLADFQLTFCIIAVIALLSIVDSVSLPRNAGDSVLKHRRT